MSKLPRDLTSEDLCRALKSLGYEITRQTGSHMRLTTREDGEHHVTIPRQSPLRVGTVAAILSEVATHLRTTRRELQERLFGK